MQKSAFICITGAPNVGKSSILNRIIGEKIAIVSSKPQTTRTNILGILTKGDTQLIFTDTPGLLQPRNKLGGNMVKSVKSSISGSDVIVLVVEAGKGLKKADFSIIDSLKASGAKAVAVINKIDLSKNKNDLIPQIERLSELYPFEAILPVSATRDDGIDRLVALLEGLALPGPFFYDENDITDQTERQLCAEYIREQILKNMHEEVPHGTAVEIERFSADEECIDVGAVIYCERDSHKGMLIGKNGEMIKKIRKASEKALGQFFEKKVVLEFWIRVKKDWRNSDYLIKSFDLSFKGENDR